MFDNVLLVLAATLTALTAGLFFCFSTAINGATHQLKDAEFMRVWQYINRVILNPVFKLTFMGPLFLLPWATFLHRGDGLQFVLLLGATIAYILGPIAITFGGNIPLNDQLDKFKLDSASDSEITAARRAFEMPWVRLHTIRTLLNILSVVLLFSAFLAE